MNLKILLLLLIAMLAVSTSPIIARFLDNVPAITISFWRMAIGAIIMWIISFLKKQTPLQNANRKRTLIAGIFLGIHFALFFGAIKLTTIANATFLGTLAPLCTLFIEKIFLKRSHKLHLLLGVGLAIIGTIIIVGNRFDYSSDFTLGNLLAIGCSLFLGMAFIISDKVRKEVTTISYARTLFTTSAITLFGIALLTNTKLTEFSSDEFIGLLLLGIIPTILGHGSMYFAIRYVSPTIVAATPMGEPIIASILAWLIFHEPVGSATFLGGSITLIGLMVLLLKK